MSAWAKDWRGNIHQRVLQRGFSNILDYLREKSHVPYVDLADELGEDVAAIQIEWSQMEEAVASHQCRECAMDSFVRDIHSNLPAGWKSVAKGDFDTAGIYSNWITRMNEYLMNFEPVGDAVWNALMSSCIPVGWLPENSTDPIIRRAFDSGWPVEETMRARLPDRP